MRAVDAAVSMLGTHLKWNQSVTTTYADLFKLYYSSALEVDRTNLEYATKAELWNLNLFDNVRAMLGAMSGAAGATGANEPSQAAKSVGGMMSGAASGAMMGSAVPGIGTAMGAGIGAVMGLASSFF